jgi:hypothetical protein
MTKQQTTQGARARASAYSTINTILSAQTVAIRQQMEAFLTRSQERRNEIVQEDVEHSVHGEATPARALPMWILTDEEERALTDLLARSKRLQQVQQLLSDDPELLRVVDASIRNRIDAATRHLSALSIVVAMLSLIAGWLLSTISPLSAAHLLTR